jgi:hypothetical protein
MAGDRDRRRSAVGLGRRAEVDGPTSHDLVRRQLEQLLRFGVRTHEAVRLEVEDQDRLRGVLDERPRLLLADDQALGGDHPRVIDPIERIPQREHHRGRENRAADEVEGRRDLRRHEVERVLGDEHDDAEEHERPERRRESDAGKAPSSRPGHEQPGHTDVGSEREHTDRQARDRDRARE